MKASELVKVLQTFIETEGDLNVGYYNNEFSSFDIADKVGVEFSDITPEYYGNDAELGIKFIGIQ